MTLKLRATSRGLDGQDSRGVLEARVSIYIEFAIAFAIVLIARGSAVTAINLMGDDFYFWAFDSDATSLASSFIAQLRAPAAVLVRLFTWLGAQVPFAGSLWAASASAGLVSFGLALRSTWIPGSASIYGVTLALMFALFPYHNNLILFTIVTPFIGVFLLCGALAMVFCDQGGWKTLASIVAFAIAVSYQAFFSYFLIAFGFMLAIMVCRLMFIQQVPVRAWLDYLKPLGVRLLCFFAGVALSVLVGKLMIVLVGSGEAASRTSFASLQELPEKIQILKGHLLRFTLRRETNVPRGVKIVQLLLLGSVMVGIGKVVARSCTRNRKLIVYPLILAAVLAVCACLPMFPMIMLSHTSLNPRVLAGIAVFWAGVFSLASLTSSLRLRALSLILAMVVVASYAFITNAISVDFSILNMRDRLAANRMVERLSLLPGYDKVRTYVVTGSRPGFNMQNLTSVDYFSSSLNIPWSAPSVIGDMSGRTYRLPSPQEVTRASERANEMPLWPAAGSVAIDGEIGIVALGNDVGEP
jgi:hypothetical protein